jgi:tight adherence protein C
MDNAIFVCLAVFLMVMMLCIWVCYRFLYKPGRILKQLGTPVIADQINRLMEEREEPQGSPVVAVLKQIGGRVPSSDAEIANLRSELIRAGFRSENAAPVFFGLRIVTVVATLIVCLIAEPNIAANQMLKILFIVSGCAAGWVLPGFFLERRVKKRQEILRLSLPDALDMLVISVEAGLGLDQAVQHVAKEIHISHPQLSEELQMVTLEMRAGKRRAEAMRNLAERTGEAELRKLVAILIQNDRFGTSMGESLRNHSDFMRTRRKQDAEERAGKVGVKLVFPIFFFILPSMIVVAAGPGLLQIFKHLFPMMKTMGGG